MRDLVISPCCHLEFLKGMRDLVLMVLVQIPHTPSAVRNDKPCFSTPYCGRGSDRASPSACLRGTFHGFHCLPFTVDRLRSLPCLSSRIPERDEGSGYKPLLSSRIPERDEGSGFAFGPGPDFRRWADVPLRHFIPQNDTNGLSSRVRRLAEIWS